MEFVKKWYPLLLFGMLAVAGIVYLFVSMKPKSGKGARYLDGRDLMEVGGVEYALINDIDAKTFIGTEVSDVVKAMHGEEKAKIQSGGLMTLAVIYKVEGDEEENYLIDSAGRLYAKKEIADRERARLADPANFPVRKVVSTGKTTESLKDLDEQTYERILEAEKDLSDNVRISDEYVTESYGLRREILAYTEDGLFCRATNELFLYNNEVYVTVAYLSADKTQNKKPMLIGTRLPDDLQPVFLPLFQ